MQLFLTLCTLVTLYFAKEVPLTPIQQHHLSDSAPLLDENQINGSDLSKSRIDSESNHHILESKSERHYKKDDGGEQKDENSSMDTFSDSPGAVLVNLLTSLRHLPPAMHSVLVVMALTWVCKFQFFKISSFNAIYRNLSSFLLFSCSNSYLGFPFSSLTLIGWGEKFSMVTRKEILMKFKHIMKVSEKVHLVCY